MEDSRRPPRKIVFKEPAHAPSEESEENKVESEALDQIQQLNVLDPMEQLEQIQRDIQPVEEDMEPLDTAEVEQIETPSRSFANKSAASKQIARSKFVQPQPETVQQLSGIQRILQKLEHTYEKVELPSRGKVYEDDLKSGLVHVRAMTVQEEKILATPRLLRSGKAINMIFQNCLQEQINPEQLLTADRTFLLIHLRGVSYGPEYEVQVRCPVCGESWQEDIDLSKLVVEYADDSIVEPVSSVLPDSGLKFTYRWSRGADEINIAEYRDRRVKGFGPSVVDDTLHKRHITLIESIEEFSDKNEISIILEKLGMRDASYIRNLFTNLPFGVDTNLRPECPFCFADFRLDLPLDASFFFPRTTKK